MEIFASEFSFISGEESCAHRRECECTRRSWSPTTWCSCRRSRRLRSEQSVKVNHNEYVSLQYTFLRVERATSASARNASAALAFTRQERSRDMSSEKWGEVESAANLRHREETRSAGNSAMRMSNGAAYEDCAMQRLATRREKREKY